jgi:hypothetical protein
VPVSFIASCCQQDLNELRGKAYNLSPGGIGIKTNYPLSVKEHLAVAFQLPDLLKTVLCVTGEVAWLQYHGITAGQETTFFSGGIKFLNLHEFSIGSLHEYVQSVVD